jgi:hypothetical protein
VDHAEPWARSSACAISRASWTASATGRRRLRAAHERPALDELHGDEDVVAVLADLVDGRESRDG